MTPAEQHQLDTWAKIARLRQQSRDMGSKDGEWPYLALAPLLIMVVFTLAWSIAP